jgi:tape measure domain-containing protein
MADDKKTLELQIRIAADEALKAVSSLKGEMQGLAAEFKKHSDSDGAIKRTFEQTQAAAEKAAASMKLFGASSGELRQMQAQVKAAAVDLVTKGLNPESEEVRKLTEEYKRLGKEAEDLDTATGKNIDSFSGLAGALRSLAEVAALTKALDTIRDMGSFALATADTFQTARNEFGTLLGDMQAGAGLFNEIKSFNDKTPFSLDTLTQATKVLLSAKVPLAGLQQQLTKFGDLSQGNSQKLTSYIQAFSKAAARGKADMEILNTYLNQGVPILDALAKSFNVTTAEIAEMAGQGKIGFEDFAAALSDLTAEGGQYFGGMELGARSLAAMQEGLKEATDSLAASFGEMLLPAATAVVKALTDITNAINESPIAKGILAGAMVALTGYLGAMAVKAGIAFAAQMSLNFAVGALNPVVLGATLAVAGLAAEYTRITTEQQRAAREAENFALKQQELKNAVDGATRAEAQRAQITAELAALYQRLNYVQDQAAVSSGTLRTAAQNLIDVLEMPIDPSTSSWIDGYRTEAEKLSDTMAMLNRDGQGELRKILSQTTGWGEAVAAQNTETMLMILRGLDLQTPEARAEIERIQEQIAGLTSAMTAVPPTGIDETKKAWQKWFSEITSVDFENIGSSGARAAELYLEGFRGTLDLKQVVSGALGTELNMADIFRDEQKAIQKAITELLAIDPREIDEPFRITDEALVTLIRRFNELGEVIRSAEFETAAGDLRKKIDDLGKSEKDLYLETARLNGANQDQLSNLKNLLDEYDRKSILSDYRQQTESLTETKHDLARASLEAAGATEQERQELESYIAILEMADATISETERAAIAWKESWAAVWEQFQDGQSANPFAALEREMERIRRELAENPILAEDTQLLADVSTYYAAGQAKIIDDLMARERALTKTRVDDLEHELREALKNLDTLEAQRVIAAEGSEEEIAAIRDRYATLRTETEQRYAREIADATISETERAAIAWKESWAAVWEQFQDGQSVNPFAALEREMERIRRELAENPILAEDAQILADVTAYYAARQAEVMDDLMARERALTKTRVDDLEYELQEALKTIDIIESARIAAAEGSEEEITAIREHYARLRAETEGEYAQKIADTIIEETERAAETSAVNWQQTLEDSLSQTLVSIEGFSAEAAGALGSVGAQFADLAARVSLDIFEEFGRAMVLAEDETYSFEQALAKIGQQILRQLPTLFLQAGLQLVATPGMWPLGLGFIAAAGASAFYSGYVDGTITKAEKDAKEAAKQNAKGGVYDEYGRAAREYAAGGAFTNRIVSQPTYFRYGGGLGVMGEAGPEAIMPLSCGSDGRLGVNALGAGGTAVYVIIENYTNEEVRTEESSDGAGSQIHKVIIGAVKESISSGEMDRPMSNRFGLRARGI